MTDSHIRQQVDAFRKRLGERSFDTISAQQSKTTRDFAARGQSWVSRCDILSSEDTEAGVVETIESAILALRDDGDDWTGRVTGSNVTGQWCGFRTGVGKEQLEPDCSEREKFRRLSLDTSSELVILYLFGGAFYSGGPAAVRSQTTALAQLTGGKCFIPAYRLAPQHAFPAPLVDILTAYLTLLYPSEHDLHEPVCASHIVLAGDSAGGSLGLALLQIIKALAKQQSCSRPTMNFRGRRVEIPLPAGFTAVGCEADHTHSLPSYYENASLDLLQIPQPCLQDRFPSCKLWPTVPPRGDIYCEIGMLCHPLVSPVAAQEWSSMPPIWLAYGQEQMIDDGKIVAQRTSEAGVATQLHCYEGLPHIFPLLFPRLKQSHHLLSNWASFCVECIRTPNSIRTTNSVFDLGCQHKFQASERFTDLSYDFAKVLMRAKRSERSIWTGRSTLEPRL